MSSPLLAIELDRVSVFFPASRAIWKRGFQSLDEVSLQIHHGDRVGVIGRNGAGKSTLLQVLAGLLQHDHGRIVRNHGYCQLLNLNLGFLPNLTGRENAMMSGLLQGFPRREVSRRLQSVNEFAELGDFFEKPLRTYSSGMRARLGLAAALQFEPDILLIDEVLGVGDAGFQKKSRDALSERIHSGITVVLVSHSDELLSSMCSKLLWIEQGRVVGFGDAVDILARYHRRELV